MDYAGEAGVPRPHPYLYTAGESMDRPFDDGLDSIHGIHIQIFSSYDDIPAKSATYRIIRLAHIIRRYDGRAAFQKDFTFIDIQACALCRDICPPFYSQFLFIAIVCINPLRFVFTIWCWRRFFL